jgi:class 3 adenylate cyclase
MFTDIEGSTDISNQRGDHVAIAAIRSYDEIVRSCLGDTGREVGHTGDAILASFESITAAVECTMAIRSRFLEHRDLNPDSPIQVRVGISAGEPVGESEDLHCAAATWLLVPAPMPARSWSPVGFASCRSANPSPSAIEASSP